MAMRVIKTLVCKYSSRNYFRKFQAKVESKLDSLEAAILTGKNENSIKNVNNNADFVTSLIKNRFTSLES